MTFDKAVQRAQHAGKVRELRFAATAPLRDLIQQDKRALRAASELSEVRKAALGGRSLSVYSQTSGPFPSWSLDLTPGLHVFSVVRSRPTGADDRLAHRVEGRPR